MVKGEISRIFAGEKEGRKKSEKFCKKLLTFVPNSYYNSQAVGNKEEQKYCKYHGILAQLGEHLPYKQRVTGSSPVGPILQETAGTTEYGGIAQLARAHGSYPWCRGFKSLFRY